MRDDLRREAAAHQADGVEAEDPRRAAAHRSRVRQRVLGDDRIAADERMPPDAAELMHAGAGADVGEVLDGDVAAERRHVAEDRVVADVAVVRDVHVRHEHVAIADLGDAAAAARAAVDGDELAEDVALADDQPRLLAAELQVLRDQADRRERKDLGAVADLGPAVDDRRRADPAVGADPDVRADGGVGTDRRARADLAPMDARWPSDRSRSCRG